MDEQMRPDEAIHPGGDVETSPPAPFICVAGMHRSGTSVMSRILNLMGMDLGPQDRLLGSRPDNPDGYWENQDVTRLNDAILMGFGGRWNHPPRLPGGWEHAAELDETRELARDVLEELFPARQVAGWKDPRMSLLLPFWRTVADIDPVVMVVRPPADVAASLRRRDGIDIATGSRLWTRYNADCWLNTPEPMIVSFADIHDDPLTVARNVVGRVGLPAIDDEVAREIAATVRPALRHHVETPASPDVVDSAHRLHELLQGADREAITTYCLELRQSWS